MFKFFRRKLQGIKIRFRRPTLENLWGQIYRDTIRGREWLQALSVSPGRAAVNYSFLYVLVRILGDYRPKSILEIGLGQSSKVVAAFVANELFDSEHTIVEGSDEWMQFFISKHPQVGEARLLMLPHEKKRYRGLSYDGYQGIETAVDSKFDLFLVDGPAGGGELSRFDLLEFLKVKKPTDEFIVIVDNYERKGERRMVELVLEDLHARNFEVFTGIYSGSNDQMVIATRKYRFATTL